MLSGAALTSFQFEREASGASDSMQNIAQGVVLNLLLPIPPIAEQKAVDRFIERATLRIDALVAKVREHIKRLREYRSALRACSLILF